jgi:hypothetical protein
MLARFLKLAGAALVAFALLTPAVWADAGDSDIDITQLHVQPDNTQAGGNPNFRLFMRFCDPGLAIDTITPNPAPGPPYTITTFQPHGISGTNVVKVLDPTNPSSDVNAFWTATRATDTTINLNTRSTPVTADELRFARGKQVQIAGNYGCNPAQQSASIRHFKLHLPPGFLGNPTAVPTCPIPVWKASLCPPETIIGHSVSETIVRSSGPLQGPLAVPSAIFNIDTLGLEPARLGTRLFPSEPPGPFPIIISLDSTGDYGLNSALVDIPRNLGGPIALVAQIDSVLCAQVPCEAPLVGDPSSVRPNPAPLGGTRPFFRNPTSCAPAKASLNASSYHVPTTVLTSDIDATQTTIPVGTINGFPPSGTLAVGNERMTYAATLDASSGGPAFTGLTRGTNSTQAEPHGTRTPVISPVDVSVSDTYPNGTTDDASTSTFTPTGCDQVPFDAKVEVQPTDTTAGAASEQKVTIAYSHNFADDAIWPSALKDADVTLPKGMALSPSGGIGLESCTAQQFGVNPTTDKQLNNDPVTCPDGSQIGEIKVHTPVLTQELDGRVFFGPVSGPGRPDVGRGNPWKLYLLIEGAGLRIKLAGDTFVSPDGQIRNIFLNQPQVPFDRFDLKIRGGERAVLTNPTDCSGPQKGDVVLTGWSEDKKSVSNPAVTPTNCNPQPFAPHVDEAGANPEQAGANTVSKIVISRTDGQPDIKQIKLSLPVGAVGSLAAVPQCPVAQARAGDCPTDTKVGTVKTTVGTGNALLTVAGSLYLAKGEQPDDAATLALVVPAKVGPIDLGQVVVINHIKLRASDTGIDAITETVPNMLEGVPLHVRRIEITVDREGFFINPTGCDTRTLTATFTAWNDEQSVSNIGLAAKNCGVLPFNPRLKLIAGAKGLTKVGKHPPLTAIVTQKSGEANIASARVVLPDILRPNVPQFNKPGGLCSDAQFAARACPKPSNVGTARVITPVLPFQLSGPVFIVQETGSILPKLYVDLKGEGLEVVLRARNSFQGIRIVNTFDGLPDVPQAYFELKIKGGPDGILNAFNDLCKASARPFDTQFVGQNGKVAKSKPHLKIEGCVKASSVGASIASRTVKVSRKGIAKIKVSCRAAKRCKGRLSLTKAGSKSFSIKAHKSAVVKVKLSKKEMRKLRKAKRMRSRATAKVGGATTRKTITLVAPKKRR